MLYGLLALSACWSAAYAEGTNDPVEDAIKGLIELVDRSKEPTKDSKSANSGQAGTSSNSVVKPASSGPNHTAPDEYWHGELADMGFVNVRFLTDGKAWVYSFFTVKQTEQLDQKMRYSLAESILVVSNEEGSPIVEYRINHSTGELEQASGERNEDFPAKLNKGQLPRSSRGVNRWKAFAASK